MFRIKHRCLNCLIVLVFSFCFDSSHLLAQEPNLTASESSPALMPPEEAASHLAKRVEPVYPPLARMTGTRGSVALRLTIATDGKVEKAVVLSGHPLLLPAALDAVKRWEYTPFVRHGKPVEATVEVSLYFANVVPRHPPVPFPEVKDLNSVVIELGRGYYALKIVGDGTVEFDGDEYVCVSGRHRGRIREEDFRTLLDAFRAANYFSLDDEYGGFQTDSYATSSSIKIGDQKKEIQYYYGAPQSLTELEDKIDLVSHSRKWVSCDEETVPALQAEGMDFRSRNKNVEAILFGALSHSDAKVVRDLIDKGINLRVRTYWGRTPLMIAAMRGLPDMVGILLKARADVSAASENGETVLMYGSSSGDADVVRQLLKAHAIVNGRSKVGNTALMAAAAAGNPEVVAILLHAGAGVNVRGWRNTTALLAGAKGELESGEIIMGDLHAEIPDEAIDRAKVVRLLIDAGADANAVDEEGENALSTIYDETVRELLKTKINVNARNKDGETPLIATVAPKVAELLVNGGAELDLADPKGRTALMHAAKNNYVEILRVLTRAGAKLDLQDTDGSTALMLCAEKGLENSVKVLIDAHAAVNPRDHENLTALGRLRRSRGRGTTTAEKLLLAAGGTE